MRKLNDKSIPYQIRNRVFLVVAIISMIIFSGCQTAELAKTDTSMKPSYWVFKTNVYSLKRNKNISGYTHITYMNPKLLRIDVYDPLGLLNAGTLIYKDGKFEAVMPFEKKYFFGLANAESMVQVLKSPIDPALFVNIIFQKKLLDKNWVCNEDSQGFVRDCTNRSAGMSIVWKTNMRSDDGWVQLTHNEGEVDLKLKNMRAISPLPESKFQLQVPKSYSKFKVDQTGVQKL